MTAASLVAFAAVFVAASLGLSLLFSVPLLLGRPSLRRTGPWVERRAASAALVLPPLLSFGLIAVLAADSALALSAADHCLDHDHHLHLCLRHGAAWASQPWALCLVAFAATFVSVRFTLSLSAHWGAQRAASRLRMLGVSLGHPACYLVPSDERFAFTAGLLSPTVVFSSAAWDVLEPEQREAMLAHELAHVAHGDLWRRAALGFAASFGAPYLVSRALQMWELSAERICDRHAARAVLRPSTVASAMLALVRMGPTRLAPEGAAFAAASHLPERIESVLREEPGGERHSRRLLIVLAVASALFAMACGAFAGPVHHALETILG
ncbi:MAG: M48 family metalloprotease [Myxococcaceae bacterium]